MPTIFSAKKGKGNGRVYPNRLSKHIGNHSKNRWSSSSKNSLYTRKPYLLNLNLPIVYQSNNRNKQILQKKYNTQIRSLIQQIRLLQKASYDNQFPNNKRAKVNKNIQNKINELNRWVGSYMHPGPTN